MAMTSQQTKAMLAGGIGTVLEFFDYSLFGFFIPILAKLFFSQDNLLFSLAVFATGFIARPAGSLYWGYMGDVYGRRSALISSLLLMSGATFTMAILPTYETLGVYSTLFLVICRIVQGFSAGGEYGASFVYVLEASSRNKRGFIGSLVGSSQTVGFLMGTLVYAIVLSTPAPEYYWRYAFLLGSLVGLVGILIRYSLPKQHPRCTQKQRNPVAEAWSENKHNILRLSGLTICYTGLIYSTYVFLQIYFANNSAAEETAFYSLWAQGCGLALGILTGYMSDRVNRRFLMITPLVIGLVLVGPVFAFGSIPLIYMFLGMILGASKGPWCSVVFDMFKSSHKLSGISLGFSIVQAMVGGLTPLILHYYILTPWVVPGVMAGCMLVGVISLWGVKAEA